MSQRTRTGIIVVVLGLLVIAGGVYVLLSFARTALAPLPAPTAIPVITQKVIVTTHDIALGALLSSADLSEVNVPVEVVPRNALTNMESAIGKYTKIPLVAGEMIMNHHLADPTNISHDMAYIIGEDRVLMAFPANDLMSTLSLIQRGDIVDVLVSMSQKVESPTANFSSGEDNTETRLFTFNAFQLVEVTGLVVDIIEENRSSGPSLGVEEELAPTPDPRNIIIRAYLLSLDPQDALVLKNLRDDGAVFDLVLRSPTSTQLFDLDPVMSEYLVDRYQLELSR